MKGKVFNNKKRIMQRFCSWFVDKKEKKTPILIENHFSSLDQMRMAFKRPKNNNNKKILRRSRRNGFIVFFFKSYLKTNWSPVMLSSPGVFKASWLLCSTSNKDVPSGSSQNRTMLMSDYVYHSVLVLSLYFHAVYFTFLYCIKKPCWAAAFL